MQVWKNYVTRPVCMKLILIRKIKFYIITKLSKIIFKVLQDLMLKLHMLRVKKLEDKMYLSLSFKTEEDVQEIKSKFLILFNIDQIFLLKMSIATELKQK